MSIVAKLQREAKANPAKAAGLGVLLLVAVYFWLPLINGFFGGSETAPAAPESSASTSAPGAVTPTVAVVSHAEGVRTAATDTGVYDWQKFRRRIEEDAKMVSSVELPNERDPFAYQQSAEAAEPDETAVAETASKVAAPITPAEAGLVLSSTLVSARKKIAEIGGKSYRVGDRVRAAKAEVDATFRIVEVYPRRVVLECDGKRYELKISRPLLDAVENAFADENDAASGADLQESAKTGPDCGESSNDELTN